METKYVIAQILVVMGASCLGISYLCSNKELILLWGILYSVFYGLQFILLGAFTGGAMSAVSIIRSCWFYMNAKNNRKNSFIIFATICILAICFGVISYCEMVSILPVLAVITFTYSIWQDNVKLYRILAIPIGIIWVAYHIHYHSVFGLVSEVALMLTAITGMIRSRDR